jgi:predicted branched-subunit amino acid permease
MFAASRPRKILYSAGMTTTHEFNPHVTRAGVRSGLSGAAAFVPGFIIFGAAIGSLAAQHGLSVAQILAQSLFVYAGASQMVVLQMWQNPWSWGGVVAVISVTAAINARFVLMGASLRPDLGALPQGRVYALLYFLTDASWAIGMRPAADGGRDFGALLAASVSLYLLWAVTTSLGFFLGALIVHPERYGLDLIMVLVFTTFLVPILRRGSRLWPYAAAGAAALAAHGLGAGHWTILIGALAGAFTAAAGRA